MTQDEAWTKFGLTEVFYDKKARYLLNVLRDDSRKIEQLRKQAHHKLICMLLPLGGTVIVEKTNFSGLAKRRSVSDGGNDLEASQADVQADSDLAATTLQTHPQAKARSYAALTLTQVVKLISKSQQVVLLPPMAGKSNQR